MFPDPSAFVVSLVEKLTAFDKKGAALLCNEFIVHLYQSNDPFPTEEAERILQQLRNKRMFEWMQKVGDALIQTGRHSFKIRRQYAQSLIDQGFFTASLAVLNQLITETENASADNKIAIREKNEGRGLIGRVYKQLYINADSPANKQNIEYLKEAIQCYLNVYTAEPDNYSWQGINTVALLHRAEQDGIAFPGFPDYKKMAESILGSISDRESEKKADLWDYATAAEACIALAKTEDVIKWIGLYLNNPYTDAFEIASTLRQFIELWKLDMDSEMGRQVLTILRAALLKMEGGNVTLDIKDLQAQQAQEEHTSKIFEKVFGDDSFKTYKWYMLGAKRCLSVAKIGRDSSKGFGTGFLLQGSLLHPKFGDDPVVITNAHVVSDDIFVTNVLRSGEAIINFEALDRDKEFSVGSILWSSPPSALDVTILQFSKQDIPKIKELTKNTEPFPIAKSLPDVDPSQRIYVIGHPFGGTLQISLQDNILLDDKDPLIHYRTPTVGGSSGSPVFNQQWQLIGIHHAGNPDMPKLHGEGTYPANEGIWIQAIIKALGE